MLIRSAKGGRLLVSLLWPTPRCKPSLLLRYIGLSVLMTSGGGVVGGWGVGAHLFI